MQALPPPARRSRWFHRIGLWLSGLVGAGLLVALAALGAMVALVIAVILALLAAALMLALRLGWRPAVLRQAEAWQQAASRNQPLEGDFTVVPREDASSHRDVR